MKIGSPTACRAQLESMTRGVVAMMMGLDHPGRPATCVHYNSLKCQDTLTVYTFIHGNS
jgi:hypothetical protein